MSYLGRSAKLSRKTQEKVSFLATAGQTVKTGLSYVSTFVEVRVNGIILTDVLDYTATDGNSITFPVALSLNDEVTVISLKTFALSNHYNRAEADAQFSTPADVTTAVSALADSAPAALDTLNELAAALGDDVNFSTTVNNSIATKLPKSGGTMTGPVVLNTNGASNSSKGLEINTSGTNFESDDGIIQVTHAAGGSTTGGYFMKMKAGGADKFTVKGDGTVTASGLAINNAGFTTATITGNSTSETQLRFDGNTAARVSNQANTALIFDTNATEKMRITAGGNVGIGTGAPTQKLDVRGIVHVQPPNTSGVQTGISLHDAGGGSSEGLNIQWSSTSDVNTAYIGSVAYDALRLGTGGSERIRITGSGNVGIGTSSPTEALHISSGGLLIDSYIPNAPASGTSGFIADYAGTNARLWSRGNATTRGGFEFKSLESDGGNQIDAMRIDSSGNVVVGATAVGGVSSGTKTYITSTGNLYVASSGEEAAYFNRNSNDGSIVEFRKNNATVGSIGTASSKIYIGSGDAGLYFNKDGNAITPVNTTTVADNDAALDLGTTTARFKDLHLSGQVNAATVSATTITGALSGNATSSSSLQQHGNNQNPNNLNNLPLGRTSNYASGGYWQNSPSGMSYGSVYNLGGQVGNYQLSLQIAADVNHNTTSSTKGLWFRTGNNLGFQNDWKEIWHGGNRAGKVLQVVNAKTGSQYSFSSSSGVCGPAVTITPKYSNSKILVMVHTDGVTNTSDANYGAFRIRRGTSVIMNYGYPMGWSSTDNARGSFSPTYLDSPATTSAVTYDTYWQDMNGTTIQINRDGAGYCLSTITVMEIGA